MAMYGPVGCEMGQAFATTVHTQLTSGVQAAVVTVQQLAAEIDKLWAFCLAFDTAANNAFASQFAGATSLADKEPPCTCCAQFWLPL